MILHQFPDLSWLKRKIEERFQSRIGWGGLPLETDGFPSVIIHTAVRETYRPDITGPISLFLNLKGESRCRVEGRTVVVPEDYFFISNRFQDYTLEIESSRPVETFNIHLGEYFSENVLGALLTPADTILNRGLQQEVATVAFQNRLYRKDARFGVLVEQLRQTGAADRYGKLLFEETLEQLLQYLLLQHREVVATIDRIPALKESTRVELYRRLSFALDYLHAAGGQEVDLGRLAETACLSKYHCLRLFRQTFGLSPYQYLQELRMEKAKRLLRQTRLPVHRIADELGFANSNSFSRLFFRRTKLYPAQYRAAH